MKRPLLLNRLVIALIIFTRIAYVHSECNVCNAVTNTACVSPTEFQQCQDNIPFGTVFECNPNTFCSILGNCTPNQDLRDCQLCNTCDSTQTFACTGTQIFALCLGNDQPSEIIGQCSGSLTCNINDARICGNTTATCSFRDNPTTTQAPTTTTPSPALDPNGFCQFIQQTGRFPVGTDPLTTCRQYVSCVRAGTTWVGPVFNCPGQSYFDTARNRCVAELPMTCTGTVSRYSFRNILLY